MALFDVHEAYIKVIYIEAKDKNVKNLFPLLEYCENWENQLTLMLLFYAH
jgi:hypothetical protein